MTQEDEVARARIDALEKHFSSAENQRQLSEAEFRTAVRNLEEKLSNGISRVHKRIEELSASIADERVQAAQTRTKQSIIQVIVIGVVMLAVEFWFRAGG
jgi:predicted  nucleic acid-binding Zn-ribbon protein